MAWSMPNTGQWNQGMAFMPDINVGAYTPEQWAALQQQNWQQWATWQQQYSQWQSQYGDKYTEQMQAIQAMGSMPPLPQNNILPPAPPPPPEKPPPPLHENNQPLYDHLPRQPAPVPPPPPPQQQTPTQPQGNFSVPHSTSGNHHNQNWSYAPVPAPVEKPQPSAVHAEALKKLAEEERLFDIQFKKWEEEIEKWRSENINHPDKQAYKEYEQRFESCRAQLLERRHQMNQKKAALLGKTNQGLSDASSKPNALLPAPQIVQSTLTFGANKQPIQQQNYQNVTTTNLNNHVKPVTNTQQYQQYNKAVITNDPYSSNSNIDPQDRYESYHNIGDSYHNTPYSASNDNTNFLQTSGSTKEIPGLDLVPESEKVSIGKNHEVIDITEEPNSGQHKSLAPDYSTISKGINNILGDEKIMNILSMVRSSQFPNEVANKSESSYSAGYDTPPSNQGSANMNNYNNDIHYDQPILNRQNMPFNNRHSSNGTNIPIQQNQNTTQNYAPQSGGYDGMSDVPNDGRMYDTRQTLSQEEYYDDNMQSYDSGRPGPQAVRSNVPSYRPLLQDMPEQQNRNEPPCLGDRRPMHNNHAISQPTPKWIHEPMFTPAIIVEYEHKPLRLKARDFIEPVHMFDYNHKSKDGDTKKDFEKEVDDLFLRKPRRLEREEDVTYGDRYNRDPYSRDYERRVKREEYPIPREEYRYRDELREDYRRPSERHEERRRDDRHSRDYRDNRDNRDNRDRDRDRDRDRERDKDRLRDYRRDDVRNRSRSRDRDFRKRGPSNDIETNTLPKRSREPSMTDASSSEPPKHIVMIDDLLESPGREMRPEKIVIILRGLPGSGKSYLAKLIRDKEAEYGGTVRIMSIDDYFMQESEIEEKDPISGKITKKPSLKYEYDEKCAETYLNSLKRAFKRCITDGYFSFMIYDAVNYQLKCYADIWNFARQNGFQVYICTMELDPHTCFKRNIHNRKLEDIELLSANFFATPSHHIQLDATTLLQNAAIPDVQMEDIDDEVIKEDTHAEVETSFTSKWEKMDDAAQLARLDGISKPLRPSQFSMEDYLQIDDWKPNAAKPGKKSVRWADIEERRQQEKIRAIGFVVGQTDWNRMTDPTMGSSALTQTKYIERVRRN